jgi:hypothetical protein
LGFAFALAKQDDLDLGKAKCPFTTSLFLLFASIVCALWCSVNRLRDFRKTERIARRREQLFREDWILPFVRQALRGVSNLEYRNYIDSLWAVLEKAHVPGIVRTPLEQMYTGQVFRFDHAPHELQLVATEAFFYLLHNGYITPAPPDGVLNHPAFNRYYVTERGRAWFNGGEPFPEEAAGYMDFLHQLIPNLDSVIEQYVIEALTAFDRRAYFAAAVMLGAASEKALYLLAESMLDAFKDAKKRNRLQSTLERRKLLELFDLVRDSIQDASKAGVLPYAQFEGSTTHLMSLFEAIRVQRNDAVHPMNAVVSADSVRLLIQSFPYSLTKSEELREWLRNNPSSI